MQEMLELSKSQTVSTLTELQVRINNNYFILFVYKASNMTV